MNAKKIIMVRPANFGFNAETSADNVFQASANLSPLNALNEFDDAVNALRSMDINVEVLHDDNQCIRPDAIFPNNWFAFLPTGEFILFSMMAENRRTERRADWINDWKRKRCFIDLSNSEAEGIFLEGTGSIIFDHDSKLAYMSRSKRSDEQLLKQLCSMIKYEPVAFDAFDTKGKPYYHTNVIMSVGHSQIILAADAVPEGIEKENLLKKISQSNKELIFITQEQVSKFCGNIIQLSNSAGKRFWVMSTTAFASFTAEQKQKLTLDSEIISADISTIENIGGGGLRCMIAESF